MTRPDVQRFDAAVLLTPAAARVLVELVNRYAQTLRTRGARFTPGVAALLAQLEEVTADAGTDANDRTPVGQHHWQALSAHDLLSTMEAAALLGCSAGNVRDLARRGAIPAHRSGGRWLLEREGVELRRGTAA